MYVPVAHEIRRLANFRTRLFAFRNTSPFSHPLPPSPRPPLREKSNGFRPSEPTTCCLTFFKPPKQRVRCAPFARPVDPPKPLRRAQSGRRALSPPPRPRQPPRLHPSEMDPASIMRRIPRGWIPRICLFLSPRRIHLPSLTHSRFAAGRRSPPRPAPPCTSPRWIAVSAVPDRCLFQRLPLAPPSTGSDRCGRAPPPVPYRTELASGSRRQFRRRSTPPT